MQYGLTTTRERSWAWLKPDQRHLAYAKHVVATTNSKPGDLRLQHYYKPAGQCRFSNIYRVLPDTGCDITSYNGGTLGRASDTGSPTYTTGPSLTARPVQ